MKNRVEIKGLCKEFKEQLILKDVNIIFESGKIYGVIGRNGTGKSLFLKMICGLVSPTQGDIIVNDRKLKKGDYATDTGVLLDCTGFMPEYTGKENLYSLAKICNKVGEKEIEDIMRKVGLQDAMNKQYRKYSLGMKQKLAIAQAFMETPSLILMDEPMNALDEESVESIRNMILDYVKEYNATVIITSHHREDIDFLCDEVYEIKKNTLQFYK